MSEEKKGSVAVETAMIMLPFLTILMAMLETGYMYFLAIVIEGATSEAARQVKTGAVQKAGAPITAFRQNLCDNMFRLVSCDELQVDVRNFSQFSGSNPPPLAGDGTGNSFAPGGAGDIVVVRVAYRVNFVTPFLGQILSAGGGDGTRLLVSSSAFRNEPFGDL